MDVSPHLPHIFTTQNDYTNRTSLLCEPSVVEANLVITCCCFLAVKYFSGSMPHTSLARNQPLTDIRLIHPTKISIIPREDWSSKRLLTAIFTWQDDSRVRIHEYGTQTDPEAGRDLEMDPSRPSPAKETRDGAHVRGESVDEKGSENENGVEGLRRNTKSSPINAITPMSPV